MYSPITLFVSCSFRLQTLYAGVSAPAINIPQNTVVPAFFARQHVTLFALRRDLRPLLSIFPNPLFDPVRFPSGTFHAAGCVPAFNIPQPPSLLLPTLNFVCIANGFRRGCVPVLPIFSKFLLFSLALFASRTLNAGGCASPLSIFLKISCSLR